METKRNNIFLALLMCFLVCLGGGAVFGLVYHIGYYIYLLSAGIIVLACTVYFKFADKEKKYNIVIAILVSIFLSIVFEMLGIFIVECLDIAGAYDIPFNDSFLVLVDLWKTNSEVATYMNTRVFEVVAMIVIGGGVYLLIHLLNRRKARKQLEQNAIETELQSENVENVKEENKVNTSSKTVSVAIVYNNLFSKCTEAYKNYAQTKNQEEFKQALAEMKKSIVLTDETKQELIKLIEENSKNQTSKQDIAVNKILLKLLNK